MNVSINQLPPLADWATDLFTGLDPSKRFTLIILVLGCITAVLCTAITFMSSTIVSIHRRRTEIDMKRDMIERGLSADEITKIVEAEPPLEDAGQRWIASWAKARKPS
jgi:hypothetical protein